MKILLIGEYSRLHNSLKEGLLALGHQVVLVGAHDGFKKFPVDINIEAKIDKTKLGLLVVKLVYKVVRIDLKALEVAYKFRKHLNGFKNYDVVQFIGESAIKTTPKLEQFFIKKLSIQNKKLYLLSCGLGYVSVKFAIEKKFKYSLFSPLFLNQKLQKKYQHVLRFLKPSYKKLHQFLYTKVAGVVASDIDYHLPLMAYGHSKYKGLIPNPINLEILKYRPLEITSKIHIFHGVNTHSYFFKGNQYFEEALEIVQNKYPEKIHITTTHNLPYNEYIKQNEGCHILLDMVYAYDQGYNALEAMAKGKVVFTGAEKEFMEYYNLTDPVAINALPSTKKIVAELEKLILNPAEIIAIGKRARAFVEKHHNYKNIAQQYVDTWNEKQ